jgi:hypothetical protein
MGSMKSAKFATLAAMAAWLMAAAPLPAHHSFGAEFDLDKPITLHGTPVKWEMINPHCYITLDVKNDDGSVTRWSIEMGAPSSLYRNGWRKDSVKPGDDLTISGYRARDGSNTIFGSQARLDTAGNYHSDQLHVVERYTLRGPDTMEYQATIEDPTIYSRPWTLRLLLHRDTKPGARIIEDECLEGADGLWHHVSPFDAKAVLHHDFKAELEAATKSQ